MIEEFIRNLVVTYVPDTIIRSMVQVIFLSGCLAIVMVLLSIGSFFMNLSFLVNRIFSPKKVEEPKAPSFWDRLKSTTWFPKVFGKVS